MRLTSLGGTPETKYEKEGHYNKFTDGGGVFSFTDRDKTIAIVASDENLFNPIGIIE